VVGEIAVARRWCSSPWDGSYAPVDAFIDPNHDTVTVGVDGVMLPVITEHE